MNTDTTALTGLQALEALTAAALELISGADRKPDDFWNPDWGPGRDSQRDRWLARLALAGNDLDLARTIDSAALRAEIGAQILCRQDRVDALLEEIRLARAVEDRELRYLQIGGLVEGIDHREVVPVLLDPVRDLPGGLIRDHALATLAVRDRDPLHLERIGDRKVAGKALAAVVATNPSPVLVRKALGQARLPELENLLVPGVRGALKLGDPKLKRRAVLAAWRASDPDVRITAFDLLGGCSFRNFHSRYAMRLLRQLPLASDDPDDPQEGTQEVALTWMAIRHGSPDLARRLRFDWTRDQFLLHYSIDQGDPEAARRIKDPTDRTQALLWQARKTGRRELADEALNLRSGDGIQDEATAFDYLVTRITLLRQATHPA